MRKLTYEFVKSYIESEGYQLISTEYKNAVTKLDVICNKGHLTSIRFGDFKNKHSRCLICANEAQRFSYEYVKSQFEAEGYTLLSTEYINKRAKLLVECPEGHQYETSWNTFQCGNRCPYCAKRRISEDSVRDYIESQGYKLLSGYVNHDTKLLIECPEKHQYTVSWGSFKYHHNRCPICCKLKANNPNWKGGVKELDIPLYSTYAHQLYPIDETRENEKGYLEVKCTNTECQKWFVPTVCMVGNRIRAINNYGGNRFYCSDGCKHSCLIFGQTKYPKGFKDYNRAHQTEWANMVKERDEYTCQRCGSIEHLVAHHIDPVACEPLLSADIDNGITLCESCHKLAHKDDGCKLSDLRRSI